MHNARIRVIHCALNVHNSSPPHKIYKCNVEFESIKNYYEIRGSNITVRLINLSKQGSVYSLVHLSSVSRANAISIVSRSSTFLSFFNFFFLRSWNKNIPAIHLMKSDFLISLKEILKNFY